MGSTEPSQFGNDIILPNLTSDNGSSGGYIICHLVELGHDTLINFEKFTGRRLVEVEHLERWDLETGFQSLINNFAKLSILNNMGFDKQKAAVCQNSWRWTILLPEEEVAFFGTQFRSLWSMDCISQIVFSENGPDGIGLLILGSQTIFGSCKSEHVLYSIVSK